MAFFDSSNDDTSGIPLEGSTELANMMEEKSRFEVGTAGFTKDLAEWLLPFFERAIFQSIYLILFEIKTKPGILKREVRKFRDEKDERRGEGKR